jgi:serine/threonine protein kinase/WD40 repeat protein
MADVQPPTVPEPAATLTFSNQTETMPQGSDLAVLPEAPGYEIVRMIGRGGMGIVYEARDKSLNRTVALKMILMGPHASDKDRRRFRQEAEAVAQLQHPGIVQIYEIGESPTGPFLALEYVGGGSLSEKLDGKPWLPLAAAELMEYVTRAVEAAHQAGIIHRDLKPANILLQAPGNRPSHSDSAPSGQVTEAGQTEVRNDVTASEMRLPQSSSRIAVPETRTPKITDFGLAKRLDSAQHHTASGAILGTPSYMAPEQAEGRSSTIGPATDVYALGAILYELLTGRPPFLAETAFDTIMQVAKQDPLPPSRLNPRVPADLETICLKCLRKEKDRRYLSATALAEDLRNFREGRPISARAIGSIERTWRWCRRNPLVAGLLSAVGILLVAGTSIATYFAVQANEQRKDAQNSAQIAKRHAEQSKKNADAALEARKEADRRLYAARVNLAQNALRDYRLIRLRELLQEMEPAEGAEDYRGWEWHYLKRQAGMETSKRVLYERAEIVPGTLAMALNDGRCAAAYYRTSLDGTSQVNLAVHDFNSAKPIFEIPVERINMMATALSPGGDLLAESLSGVIRIWELRLKKTIAEIPVAKGSYIHALAFDNEFGSILAIAEGSRIRVVDPRSGKDERTAVDLPKDCFAYQLVLSSRYKRIYYGQMKQQSQTSFDSQVNYFDLEMGNHGTTAEYMPGERYAPFAVNRQGNLLAIAQGKKRVVVWDVKRQVTLNVIPVLSETITAMNFLGPQEFAIGGVNGLVSIYQTQTLDEPTILRSHTHPVVGIMHASGQYVSVDTSADACIWNPFQFGRHRITSGNVGSAGMITPSQFSPSGRILLQFAGPTLNRSLHVWDIGNDERLKLRRALTVARGGLGLLVGRIALSGNEQVAAAVIVRHEYPDAFGSAAGVLPGLAIRFGGPGPLPRALIDVGARVLASDTEVIRVVDLVGVEKFPSFKLPEPVHQIFLSGDGRHLLTAASGWHVHETASARLLCGVDKRDGLLSRTAIHPEGRRFAAAVSRIDGLTRHDKDKQPVKPQRAAIILRWFDDTEETALPLSPEVESCTITQIQFSPSGNYLWATAFENTAGSISSGSLNLRILVWKRNVAGNYERVALPGDGRFAAYLRETVAIVISDSDSSFAIAFRSGQQSAEARVGRFGADRFDSTFRFQGGDIEFAAFTGDSRRLLVVSGSGGGSDLSGAELHVFDLISKQELLEIPLGRIIGALIGGSSAYHFDGRRLRVASWNDRGAEMRLVDGAPR